MKPILFNIEMVRAILGDRKTVTRRVVKPQPRVREENPHYITSGDVYFDVQDPVFGGVLTSVGPYKPPCYRRDILYVREAWAPWSKTEGTAPTIHYKADGETLSGVKWRPSIHMPREAARLFLRVKSVGVERLQDIDGYDILAEGVDNGHSNPAMGKRWENMQRMAFSALWDNTIKPADRALYAWGANPWVWVIEFERISREEAAQC